MDSNPNLTTFITEHPILTLGLLDPVVLTSNSSGTIYYNTRVHNVTRLELLPLSITTAAQVEQLVYDLLLGNWTCVVENDMGCDSITYTIKEPGEQHCMKTVKLNFDANHVKKLTILNLKGIQD